MARIRARVSVDSAGAQANGRSGWPALSGDGRWVTYSSLASNLVPGDTNRGHFADHDLKPRKFFERQREFFLREQLKVIKQELGLSKDDRSADVEKFESRLAGLEVLSLIHI